MSYSKFHARRTRYNGRIYDSAGESRLAAEIEMLKRIGEVSMVIEHASFPLKGLNGSVVGIHRVDFCLRFSDGRCEAWEFKGFPTEAWKLKRRLFEDNYPAIRYLVRTRA